MGFRGTSYKLNYHLLEASTHFQKNFQAKTSACVTHPYPQSLLECCAWLLAADIVEPCHVLTPASPCPLQSWAPPQALSDNMWSRLTTWGRMNRITGVSHQRWSSQDLGGHQRDITMLQKGLWRYHYLCQMLMPIHYNHYSYLTCRTTVPGSWGLLTRVGWQHQPCNKVYTTADWGAKS